MTAARMLTSSKGMSLCRSVKASVIITIGSGNTPESRAPQGGNYHIRMGKNSYLIIEVKTHSIAIKHKENFFNKKLFPFADGSKLRLTFV